MPEYVEPKEAATKTMELLRRLAIPFNRVVVGEKLQVIADDDVGVAQVSTRDHFITIDGDSYHGKDYSDCWGMIERPNKVKEAERKCGRTIKEFHKLLVSLCPKFDILTPMSNNLIEEWYIEFVEVYFDESGTLPFEVQLEKWLESASITRCIAGSYVYKEENVKRKQEDGEHERTDSKKDTPSDKED